MFSGRSRLAAIPGNPTIIYRGTRTRFKFASAGIYDAACYEPPNGITGGIMMSEVAPTP